MTDSVVTTEDIEVTRFTERLLVLLEEQNAVLSRLKKNLRAQYETLLHGRMKNFLPLLEEQQALLWEVEKLEELREQLVREFVPGKPDITLSELTAMVPVETAEKLRQLQSDFVAQVRAIRRLRERNQHLIRKSLELIQSQIREIQQLVRTGYDERGNSEQPEAFTINRRI